MDRNLRTLQAREEQENHFSGLRICERIQSFTSCLLKGCPPGLDPPPPGRPRLPESPPSGWTVRLGPSWAGSSGPGAATACAGGSSAASRPSNPDPPCAHSSSPGKSGPKRSDRVYLYTPPMYGLSNFACWGFMEFNYLQSGLFWNLNEVTVTTGHY